MNFKNIILSLALTTGACTNTSSLVHQSSIQTRVNGIELSPDGSSAQIGMNGASCEVNTNGGYFILDSDVIPGSEEWIQDSSLEQTLVIGEDRSQTFVLDGKDFNPIQVIQTPNVEWARFTDAGIVTLENSRSGCNINFISEDGELEESKSISCQAISLDSSISNVFLTDGENISIISIDETTSFKLPTEDISIYNSREIIYAVNNSTITAISSFGEVLWEKDLGSEIQDLDTVQSSGEPILMLGDENSDSILFLLFHFILSP